MGSEFQILHFQYVNSTQDLARQILRENVVVLADTQKSGRGRFGRFWHSPIGGLWFTAIIRVKLPLQIVSLMAGVTIAKALEDMNVRVCLKWPNDVIMQGKKLGGIIGEVHGDYVLLGVGINLRNEIPEEISDIAINLSNVSRDELLLKILEILDEEKKKSKDEIIKEWKAYNCTLGKRVRIVDNGEYEGRAEDIDDDGFLLVRVGDELKKVLAGDVQILE
ncbi:biotin--[acetyl-CoA-carboxylase] ligase [Aciduliprofundum sp. MAR08-339]|uniref:biotin--[acetyl-CoA-carboxylase] ligase n=1 Tax=Aciduliprofundum sp. (strain MAR08-339) TaxID=673860 RepID=UPI00138A5B8A